MCLLMSLTSSVLPSLSGFYLKCYLYLLLLSSLPRNCRYNQLCKYAVVSNPPPPRFVFWFSLFVRQVESSNPCFLFWIPNTWMGFDGEEVWGGGGADKETFSWDAFTSKFLLERVAVIRVDSDSLWDPREGLESTECAVWMHTGRRWKDALVAVRFYRLPSRSRTPENLPLLRVTQVLHLQLARCVVTGKHAIETSSNVFRCSRTSGGNWDGHQCRANSRII